MPGDVNGHRLHTAGGVEPGETDAHGEAFSSAWVFVVLASDDEGIIFPRTISTPQLCGLWTIRISRQRLVNTHPAPRCKQSSRSEAPLKFFQLEGFFPSSVKDIPSVAIDHMAKLLDVEPKAISDYDWQGRTGARYRRRLRAVMGIRRSTAKDFKAVEEWLRKGVVPWDHGAQHLQDAVHAWYRSRRI